MIAPADCILILLAAGGSERFGDADKLTEMFQDRPLAFHIVTALENVPFKARLAVCSGTTLDFASRGYTVVPNAAPETGMAGSVRLGVAAARDIGCGGVLIALADMPRVTARHVFRLFDAADGPASVVASSDGVRPSPPAIFGAGQFDALLALQGEEGARVLIRGGRHVIASGAELLDIDRPEDLERLRGLR